MILQELYAIPSGIDFYSPNSTPDGVKSLEPLIAKWWNWWEIILQAWMKIGLNVLKEMVDS